VHRTNFLMGHPWGEGFQYDEMQMLPGPPAAGAAAGMGGFSFGAAGMPKPGEGPTREERESGYFEVLVIAEDGAGRAVRTSVKGDKDPGYGSTAKMLGESAVCLARDVPRSQTPGGCWTPAAAMDGALIRRLEANAGLTFTLEN
jgi:short subunit dehydrogenase-like uncharacterized protein